MPGSELARARANLRRAQFWLAHLRLIYVDKRCDAIRNEETFVLAALSWVWDAQERAYAAEVQPYFDYVSATLQQTTDDFLDLMAKHLMPKKRSRARAKAASR